MLFLVGINYAGALIIESADPVPIFRQFGLGRKGILSLVLLADLLTLFVYKYLDFALSSANSILVYFRVAPLDLPGIALPIGISFYCFQAMSYLVDVYRTKVPAQRSPASLALYISLFPQLIAGPIVRYEVVLDSLHDRSLRPENLYEGLSRFAIGLAKKVLIADNMGFIADKVFVDNVASIPTPWAWVGVLAYTLQIYYDFAGYSDMAIGLGRVFNFHFPENFNFPYCARSMREFWRRWHISLSTWLRDYLYIPLGGGRVSPVRLYLNLMITVLLCGLWHGASWNFVVWGGWHGLGLVAERVLPNRLNPLNLPGWLGNLYVLLIVVVGWVFFRAPDLSYAVAYLNILFCGNGGVVWRSFGNAWDFMTLSNLSFFVVGVVCAYPAFGDRLDRFRRHTVGMVLLATLFLVAYLFAVTSTFSPFIYFRF